MKKTLLAIAWVAIFAVPALRAQGKTILPYVPGADKIMVKGGTIFYAGSPYLSISVVLTRAGSPLLGARVRMNDVLLRGSTGGYYAGAYPTPFKADIGQEQLFTIETLAPLPGGSSGSLRRERLPLASYRVDRLLQWLAPRPDATIDLSAFPLGELPLRWRFIGATTPVKGRLTVIERGGRGEIINRVVEGDECTVPIAALRPDKEYLISINTSFPDCGPMGVFKLGKIVDPGSEVHFEWEYGILIKTAAGK